MVTISGVARNFWVMGRFPAKLFWEVGNNGQLKTNWATFFLKTYCHNEIEVYWRETRHSQIRGELSLGTGPASWTFKPVDFHRFFTDFFINFYTIQISLFWLFLSISMALTMHKYELECLQLTNFSLYQNSCAKFRANAFSSYNGGLGSCWMYWLWPRKVSKLLEAKICLYIEFYTSKFLSQLPRPLLINCQKLSMTSSFQLMPSL
jgi:hypothetical protein